mmetsp:Transcript_42589/g.107458  ORF Transcript_42589/g.107458 Transcript_42589/m.107458 type:complete len:81 (+) Transcript_42589:2220-2462(+)
MVRGSLARFLIFRHNQRLKFRACPRSPHPPIQARRLSMAPKSPSAQSFATKEACPFYLYRPKKKVEATLQMFEPTDLAAI